MTGQVMTTFRGLSKVTTTNFGTMNGQMMAPNYNWRMTSEVVMKNPMRFCRSRRLTTDRGVCSRSSGGATRTPPRWWLTAFWAVVKGSWADQSGAAIPPRPMLCCVGNSRRRQHRTVRNDSTAHVQAGAADVMKPAKLLKQPPLMPPPPPKGPSLRGTKRPAAAPAPAPAPKRASKWPMRERKPKKQKDGSDSRPQHLVGSRPCHTR